MGPPLHSKSIAPHLGDVTRLVCPGPLKRPIVPVVGTPSAWSKARAMDTGPLPSACPYSGVSPTDLLRANYRLTRYLARCGTLCFLSSEECLDDRSQQRRAGDLHVRGAR